MRIGYLGLGVMGRGMSANLLKRFGRLTVWNRTPSRADDLVAVGACPADSPVAVARTCNVVCVCVSDTPDVDQVMFGPDGAAEGLQEGSLVIDFSTISDKATERFAEKVRSRGATWLDAPVSGGDVGARNGTLTVMIGGPADAVDRAMPVFEAVGKKIVHMGDTGSGQRTKMANQIAVCGTILSMAETLNFAREKGMDVSKVLEVVSSGAAGSWSLANYGPRVLKGDFDPGFAVALMAKDLRLVLENLDGLDAEYTAVRKLAAVFEQMKGDGKGDRGIHSAVKELGWPSEG